MASLFSCLLRSKNKSADKVHCASSVPCQNAESLLRLQVAELQAQVKGLEAEQAHLCSQHASQLLISSNVKCEDGTSPAVCQTTAAQPAILGLGPCSYVQGMRSVNQKVLHERLKVMLLYMVLSVCCLWYGTSSIHCG